MVRGFGVAEPGSWIIFRSMGGLFATNRIGPRSGIGCAGGWNDSSPCQLLLHSPLGVVAVVLVGCWRGGGALLVGLTV